MTRLLSLLFILVFAHFSYGQKVLASHQFEADNVASVVIDARFCDVEIKNGNRVVFNGVIEGSGDPDDYEISSDLRGSDLYIEVEKRTRGWDRIGRSLLELTVPDNVMLRIETSSGDIKVAGLRGESFQFESTSGDIDLIDMEARLEVSSTSGDIEVRQVVGRVTAESTSGSQEFQEIDGDIRTECTSGDVDVSQFNGEIRARATSGNIEIERGRGSVFLRATSGDIEGYQINLTGDSEFRASSGNVDIDLANDLEEFSFDLQTSSGNLRVGSRTAEKTLFLRQGGYWIRGVTSSGNLKFNN